MSATLDTPISHGEYHLVSAQMISMPQMEPSGAVNYFGPPPRSAYAGNGPVAVKRVRLSQRSGPRKKARGLGPPAPPPPPPPPPPISSVGVMDVGQGNCNMLINHMTQPAAYFDAGYPLWFFTQSTPLDIRPLAPAPSGPIIQNAAENMEVVLSHWDWDHWRLAFIWPELKELPWLAPEQPMGPVTANFAANLANLEWYEGPAVHLEPNYTLYTCNPGPLAPAAMVINNTGLAISVRTELPVADPVHHEIAMTGDANFSSLPILPAALGATGITAVHHGSNAHGAAEELPAPAFPYALEGRIAYSCGRMPNGVHPYGFPVALAVTRYHEAGWGAAPASLEFSTAQGQNIVIGPAARGNIRMGNQAPLPAAYEETAFYEFPHALE